MAWRALMIVLLALCAGCAETLSRAELRASDSGAIIEATGVGLPAVNAATADQRRLTALEAARHGALAQLAENAHGVRVAKESRVRDAVFAGQEVEARVRGVLAGAQVVSSEYDEGAQIARVTVRVALDTDGNIALAGLAR